MSKYTQYSLVVAVLVVLVAATAVGLLAGCNKSASTSTTAVSTPEATSAAGVVYTCPMHPEVTSNKPGKCPKCGMNLVKKGS